MFKFSLLAIGVASLVTACSSAVPVAEPPAPTRVQLVLNSALNLNPDVAAKPAPVVFRIYQLRAQSNFMGADFFALFGQEKTTLADELLAKQEFLLQPGEVKQVLIAAEADTHFIGFFAAFKQLDNAQWRLIAPIQAHQDNAVAISLENNQITGVFPH
ncbi:MAG: type VI secretion system lipoprotein TssJ [Methylococcaceae bacterium]|jgi:type VI secretion system protein VasD